VDESSLVAAAFPFFFGAAFGCVAARRLRSGFDVDAAAVTVALALLLLLLLLLLGDTVAPVLGAPCCVGLSSSSLLLISSSDCLAALAKGVD
jgi:hypothetical protein